MLFMFINVTEVKNVNIETGISLVFSLAPSLLPVVLLPPCLLRQGSPSADNHIF